MDDQGTAIAPPPAPATPPAGGRGPAPTRPRRARRWLVPLVLAALGGSAVAYAALARGHRAVEGHTAEPETGHRSSPRLPVEVAHPRPGGVERTTTQAGSVHAFEHASLYSKVSGYLKVQNVDIGDRVRLGQLLAVIDDPEVDKAVDQNQAALDQAKAKARVAEAKVRSARAAQEAAQALVQQAETMITAKSSNEDLQRKQLARIAGLVARRAVEEKLQDEQQDRYDVAAADVGVARAEVISAKAEVMNRAALVEEAQADLVEARANVEVAEADLARARVMQDYTRITSPYDGVVTLRSFHRGDFVRSATEGGNVPLLAVARTDLMRVVLPIPDVDVPYTDRGDRATLQIVALPGRAFAGTISRFAESEDPESRNMRTELDIPNPDSLLREGMYGRVTVILQPAAPSSVTVPSTALLGQSGTGAGSVYVVRAEKAHRVPVRIGNDNGIEAEILGGLAPEDEVITSYNGTLDEGTPVKTRPATTAGPAPR